ncbi:lysozyme-like protein [Anaeromyces robustus]|uniref:Lysozyme-like protein n=1 Tax=Anaeromyces robustus TaxID=1754192 RepID=A0A1Y1V803_9FUNG|nr:lysozyme-like protein [Anaeromyces robustus]|eukprot:ORX48884.1 lysozyme-like protein [Anaeromyces robustus]
MKFYSIVLLVLVTVLPYVYGATVTSLSEGILKYEEVSNKAKLQPYCDETSQLWHIGYGHNCNTGCKTNTKCTKDKKVNNVKVNNKFTASSAQKLLDNDVQSHVKCVTDMKFTNLNNYRKSVLVAMSYQLGCDALNKNWPNFIKNVKNSNWKQAVYEMKHNSKGGKSKWYEQTPGRVDRLGCIMEKFSCKNSNDSACVKKVVKDCKITGYNW